jgi:hypothetical protein
MGARDGVTGGDALGTAAARVPLLAAWPAASGAGLGPDVVNRAMTADVLLGAADQDATMRLPKVIPDLVDPPAQPGGPMAP